MLWKSIGMTRGPAIPDPNLVPPTRDTEGEIIEGDLVSSPMAIANQRKLVKKTLRKR